MHNLFIPKYVYKYTRFNDYWEDIFLHQRLYMPSPSELNDPFEGQLIAVNSGTAGNTIGLAAGKFNKDIGSLLKNYRILSLSANIRNKAMWAHYANQYCGFALQFNTRKSFSDVERIMYRPDYETGETVYITSKKDCEEKNLMRQALLVKSKDWENEEEFRIVDKITANEEKTRPHYYDFEQNDLEGIILGANLDFDTASKYQVQYGDNVKKLLAYAHALNVPVYYSWTVPIKSKIEFYREGNRPQFDGGSYMKYIEKTF